METLVVLQFPGVFQLPAPVGTQLLIVAARTTPMPNNEPNMPAKVVGNHRPGIGLRIFCPPNQQLQIEQLICGAFTTNQASYELLSKKVAQKDVDTSLPPPDKLTILVRMSMKISGRS